MPAPVKQLTPLTTFQRERILPYPGRILVRKGQKVTASDIVSDCRPHEEYYLVDASRVLGIPTHRISRYIRCEVGNQISKGDVIAGPVGFPKRVIRSTKSGKVVFTGRGLVLIELDEQPLACTAGYPGEVVELLGDHGVIVQTSGSLIQGVWGNGRVGTGPLKILAGSPNHVLEANQLEILQPGEIILAGYCQDVKVFESFLNIPVGGLILGSMSNSIKRLAHEMPFPVIVLEGFGHYPINPVTFQLLMDHQQSVISINAEIPSPARNSHPEIIIPIEDSEPIQSVEFPAYFAVGQWVRVLHSTHARQSGILSQLKGFVTFPSGVRAQAAEIILDGNQEKSVIPLANLEILL